MVICSNCRAERPDSARFCDECGARLVANDESTPPVATVDVVEIPQPVFFDRIESVQSVEPSPAERSAVTTIDTGIESDEAPNPEPVAEIETSDAEPGIIATLTIERGDAPGTVFELRNATSVIGRWDADNGIFPDVDLDAYDPDAKVSRKHAKIISGGGKFFVEDMGSTNGTYVNRGRRLLPGTPQQINDGDEVIVGKTFLRFKAL